MRTLNVVTVICVMITNNVSSEDVAPNTMPKNVVKSLKNTDIVFLVDSSASIGTYGRTAIISFLKELVKQIFVVVKEEQKWHEVGKQKKPLRIGIISFTGSATIVALLAEVDPNSKTLLTEIESLPQSDGGTNIKNAIAAANDMLRPGHKAGKTPCIVLFTDGADSSPWENELKHDVKLISVGVRIDAGYQGKLMKLSDKFLFVHRFQELPQILDDLAQAMSLTLKYCTFRRMKTAYCHPKRFQTDKCVEEYKSYVDKKADDRVKYLTQTEKWKLGFNKCKTTRFEKECTCPTA